MPLLDHFRTPVETRAPWESIGTLWVGALMRALNRSLPKDRYLSLATVHLGSEAEADVSEFELLGGGLPHESNGDGGVATLTAPAAVATFEPSFPDEFTVRVNDLRDNMRLVGAIELISPANKDRDQHRQRFLAKCLAYLDAGIGLVLVDIVCNRVANLHNELMDALDAPPRARLPDVPCYVAGYRSTRDDASRRVETWHHAAALGHPIPGVPLALKSGPVVMLDLENSYTEVLADHNL